ncbi:ATP-dependent nuclease [Paraclostridium bifermentans]|uniref:ATP-dependent nuclease n=1 Tax=Paraclostridium bifermentans TaxID=1490 RepID=UPI0022E05838|nr:AAA family ATPase [Paraclostridium bifermentans]
MKIEKIHIENFRSIKKQTIEDIQDALILIGKNNAGKSAIINAIRAFWGDIDLQKGDFYKNSTNIIIEITFSISDGYLKNLFYDSKLGFFKIPSSAKEFNLVQEGTLWSEHKYNDYKDKRDEFIENNNIEELEYQFYDIWVDSIKNRFSILNNQFVVQLKSSNDNCKVKYYINGKENRDIISLFPNIAFINDDRNFLEEETGKSKTFTANLFNNVLIDKVYDKSQISCKICDDRNCKVKCIQSIYDKKVENLSVNELEKLVNYKTNISSQKITQSITKNFQQNYRDDYKIAIKATSSVDKSYTLSTKIFDPMLETEIDLSNVGAGVRSIYILSLLQAYQDIMENNYIFIIEEPELYLHPELQKSMVKTLYSISMNNQVFFTTHSPIMLKAFDIENVRSIRLDIDNCETIIEKAEINEVLKELGYASQDIIHKDFVLFVEGSDDLIALNELINHYYNIDFSKILIIDTKSCQNIETYATLRFLEKTTMSSEFAIFRDSDTGSRENVKTKVINQMRENIEANYLSVIDKNIFVTEYSSIEGYFIDIDLLLEKHVFKNYEKLKDTLISKLNKDKLFHIEYFKKNNKKFIDRINKFEQEYDLKVKDPIENIEWFKKNIRGHHLYGYLNASKLNFKTIIEESKSESFTDILNFLDTIEYFKQRKKDIPIKSLVHNN